ncbi:tetratricopeptide repeat protein [Nonomuraea sp. NPDC049486]|uniref:tetratricopeptide repeat protein n=1 Tax=Nonomuraea sp. NPDC049486 TaxID=3155773 RepID=UPI0034226C18
MHWLSRAEEALACFDRALRAWAGYDAGTALALHGRGVVLRVLERYEESLESLERARAAWHRLGHARQEAGCLTGVGLTCQRLGRHDDAVAAHEAAIGLARDSAARVTEVMALGNLGEAHRLAGRREAAAACFTEALRLDRLRGLSGTYWEAEHLWGLGRVRGDRALLNRSAAILRDLDLIDDAEAGAIATGPAPRTPAAIADQL